MAYESAKPGAFKIDEMVLTNSDKTERIDVEGMYVEVSLYEDMYTPCMTCAVTLLDSQGLLDQLPVVGDETLDVRFYTPGESKSFSGTYRIHKINNQIQSKMRAQMYTLHGASPPLTLSNTFRVSSAYGPKLGSDIVRDVFNEHFSRLTSKKLLTVEPTRGLQRYVFPRVSPLIAMRMLASESESDENLSSSYLFFENHRGYHFATIEYFSKKSAVDTFYLGLQNIDLDTQNDGLNPSKVIRSIERNNSPDTLRALNTGYLGSTSFTIDLVSKTFDAVQYDYTRDFSRVKQVGELDMPVLDTNSNLLKGANESVSRFIATNGLREQSVYINSREQQYPRNRHKFAAIESAYMLQQSHTNRRTITIPGYSGLAAGDIVNLTIPEQSETKRSAMSEDRFDSGDYLATTVCHRFNSSGEYINIVELTKGSFESKPRNVRE